ncbi:MAG: hypothetical protein MZV70_70290 [Desulfobacterales bacterium]|nr:hypothetical protein [Desulfobacterales bacterium]
MSDGRIVFSEHDGRDERLERRRPDGRGRGLGRPQAVSRRTSCRTSIRPSPVTGPGPRSSPSGGVQAARDRGPDQGPRGPGAETKIPLLRIVNTVGIARLSPDGSLVAYRDMVDGKAEDVRRRGRGRPPRALCEGCFVPGFFPGQRSRPWSGSSPDEMEQMDLGTGARKVVVSLSPEDDRFRRLPLPGRAMDRLAGRRAGRTGGRSGSLRSKRPDQARGADHGRRSRLFSRRSRLVA